MESDSTIISFKGKPSNPFRSRSTIVCLLCLLTLTGINLMAVKTGFFNEAFALVSVYIIKDILTSVFMHQIKSDHQEAKDTLNDKEASK